MKEGSRFLLFLITPNGDFIMSAKRIEIANKLLVDFPSGRATQSELMEWAEANGFRWFTENNLPTEWTDK